MACNKRGLQTALDEAANELNHYVRDHERQEARAETARLLRETFAKHRHRARQRYVQPSKERIDQLGRIVFGTTLEVELDEDLQVVRRTLDGTTLDVSQLSTGAREQLGVISRLACATIVSPLERVKASWGAVADITTGGTGRIGLSQMDGIIDAHRTTAWRWVQKAVERAEQLGALPPGREVGTQ